jgi:hypothetical protein
MIRRVRLGLAAGVLGLTGLAGCVHDGEWSVSKALGWEPKNTVRTPDPPKFSPASLQAAERVETLGRRVIAQNTFTGLDPLFHTIGVAEPMLFHRGTGELFISEGLVNRCKTEAELAAVLCSELGHMMTEKQAARRVGRDTDPIPDVRAPNAMEAGGITADQTRLAELAYHEKRYPRTPAGRDEKPPVPGDPAKLARDLLKGAGFEPAELDRAEPILKQTDRTGPLRKQMAGSAPAPTWGR